MLSCWNWKNCNELQEKELGKERVQQGEEVAREVWAECRRESSNMDPTAGKSQLTKIQSGQTSTAEGFVCAGRICLAVTDDV